ncbi:MAG: OmpA family protein [Myxococcota bacterium]
MATPPERRGTTDPRGSSRGRRFRKVERSSISFFPAGFFGLVGLAAVSLFALFPFAQLRVEGAIRDRVRARLDAEGLHWVDIGISGRTVYLTGAPPDPSQAERAADSVKSITIQSFFGPLEPVEDVITDWSEPPPPPPAPAAAPRWTDWEFRLERGVLALTGTVADDDTRNKVLGAANRVTDPPRVASVRDNLAVADQPAPEVAAAVAERGVATLGRCVSGVATFAGGTFSLRCELPAASMDAVRSDASAPIAPAVIGAVELVSAEQLASCEQALASVLRGSPVRFAKGEAALDPAASPAVDQLAEAARGCSARLRIRAPGDDPADPTLGRARAEVVRRALIERGVQAERLAAVDVGPTGPVSQLEIDVARSTEL